MNAIDVKNVSLKVGPSSRHSLSFHVEEGTVCGLVGKNGAGKTLLLQALVRQHEMVAGDIQLLGRSISTDFESIKPDIGVVWATFYGPIHFSATDYRNFYAPYYDSWDDDYFYSLLKQFELHPTDKIKNYSSGMIVKLQFALALAHHPKLLILDEPTAHLDPFARDELMELLSQFMEVEGRSILISSHILSDLEKIADSILFIENGDILYHENKDDLTSEYVIWRGELLDIIPAEAVMASKPTALGQEYLLAKKLLPEAFFDSHGHHVHSASIEEYLLYTKYTLAKEESR